MLLYAGVREPDTATVCSNPDSSAQGVACRDTVNRGAVFSNGRVYFNTLDGHTCALDAATGTQVWKAEHGDVNTLAKALRCRRWSATAAASSAFAAGWLDADTRSLA